MATAENGPRDREALHTSASVAMTLPSLDQVATSPRRLKEATAMIRVLMLDLGETLIHGEFPLPHVLEALAALRQFETASGDLLAMCLVSDFKMPEPPATPAKINALFLEYLNILEHSRLKDYFEPVERCVTLSMHAGVFKPDRKIFETAIERLGVLATLEDCLFITENVDHIKACGKLHMKTIAFGEQGSADGFDDWALGPMLIARLIAPSSHKDTELALKVSLAAEYRMDLVSATPVRSPRDAINARVKVWHALDDPSLGELNGVHVELPADAEIDLDARGAIQSVRQAKPAGDVVAEATQYVRGLAGTGKVASDPKKRPFGATHEVSVDSEGRRYLKRKRYSAL
jgi:beta-phosphoglucomutase-like phosphatase (HAD superfamily)